MHTKTVAAATVEVMYRMVSLYPHPLLVTKFLILYLCMSHIKSSAIFGYKRAVTLDRSFFNSSEQVEGDCLYQVRSALNLLKLRMHFEVVGLKFFLCTERIMAGLTGKAGVHVAIMLLPIYPIIECFTTYLTDKCLFSHEFISLLNKAPFFLCSL